MGVIANLVVRVTANTSDLDRQFAGLEQQFTRIGGQLTSVGARLTQGITVPLVAAGGISLKFAADFEKSMTKLVTLSGISEDQMQQLKQSVLELAPTVGIGPRALTEALLVVTSTGFKGAQAMQILEFAAKASAVGMGDTKDVARALTAAISAYGSENLTAAQAADILHATVVAGGAEATELAGEIGRVIGVASQLGVSFEEVGAFIATYTRLGLSAAEATTGLSGVLNTILNPSREAREALAGLGISAQGLRAAVAEQGLGATLTELIGRLKGNADATGALFGNVRALAGVMGTAGSQAESYRQNLSAITNSTGGLNAAFQITRQTLGQMWNEFLAEAETVAIMLGTQLLPALKEILVAAKPVLHVIVGLIQQFAQLPQPVQTTVIGFFAFAAALGPIVFAVGKVIQAFGAWITLTRLAAGGTAALTGALGMSGAAFAIASAHILTITGLIGGLIFAVSKAIPALINLFSVWREHGTKALLGELGRNVKDDDLSVFKEFRLDQQPKRRRGGGSRGDFILDPNAIAGGAATARAKQDLEDLRAGMGHVTMATDAARDAADRWQRAIGRVTGQDLIDKALETIKLVKAAGGVGAIAPQMIAPIHRELDQALDVLMARGEALPPVMFDLWKATMPPLEVIQGVSGLVDQFGRLKVAGSDVSAEFLHFPDVATALGLPANFDLPGFNLPEAPAKTWAQRLFGAEPQEIGAALGRGIFDGLRGIGDEIGRMLASEFGGLGQLGKKLSGMFGSTGLGGMFGGFLGSLIPGLGGFIGPLFSKIGGFFKNLFGGGGAGRKAVQEFARSFGGFDALHGKLSELGDQGEVLWKKLTQGVGKNNPEQAKAVIDDITAALERQQDTLKQSIATIVEGVNLRAAHITGQADIDVVGAGALAAFALQLQQGMSAIAAFQAIAPAVQAMQAALETGNVTVSESVARLLDLGLVLEMNRVEFENLGASGQILQAMLQGNIKDGTLFAAVATDIGTQIQTIIDRGVPMAQVFALAQPQLQALWEAQRKWGFAVDATTAGLLQEAEAQGFVGAAMQSVNQQILNVLIAIGDVLGAQIPDALRQLPAVAQEAASGMQRAFDQVTGPGIVARAESFDLPQLGEGGIVRGPTVALLGESGPEAVVPLDRDLRTGQSTVILEVDGATLAEIFVPHLPGVVQRYGLA